MLDEEQIIQIVKDYQKNSIGDNPGELSDQRAKSMEYYLGKPYGNEEEDRSKVVSTDVMEVVEWYLPWLLKEFMETDKAVSFEPVGPEDEELANQATDYISNILYVKNEGFLILYTWIKDALLSKNGYVKVFWEETEEWIKESYEGLTGDQFLQVLDYDEDLIKFVSHSERIEQTEDGQGETSYHDIEFRRKKTIKRVRVINVPPEEFEVSRNTTSISLDDSEYSAHNIEMTIGELRAEGIEEKKIKQIEDAVTEDRRLSAADFLARSQIEDDNILLNGRIGESSEYNKANTKVIVNESYSKIDVHEDGVTQFYKVRRVGDVLIDYEEIDYNPFCAITPVILPHKHNGLSVYDMIGDLQLEKSALKRIMMDYSYDSSNPGHCINGNVNKEQMLDKKPGYVVETTGIPSQDIMTLIPSPLPPDIMGMFALLDKSKEHRTGVGENFMGSNQSIKGDTAHGVERLMTAMEQKVALIARIFAEVGIKNLCKKIYKLVTTHQDIEDVVKLRNKWVTVNPRDWQERNDLTISIGLGAGDKNKKLAALREIYTIQKEMLELGFNKIITEEQIYNTVAEIAKNSGIINPDNFILNPQDPKVIQAKQAEAEASKTAPPDPQMLLLQLEQDKIKGDQEKAVLENSIKMQELKLKRAKQRDDLALSLTELEQENNRQLDAELKQNMGSYNNE